MITKYTRLILSLLFLASSIIINSQTILYVKKGSTGNGSSWNNAYGEVADALKYAKENETQWTETKPLQIWVAKGTYKPLYDPADNNFGNLPINDPRDVSYLMVNNVQLYGGFLGNETDLTARDWETNKTILSGDLNGDDGANFTNNADNAYNVVLSIGKSRTEPITSNTILDGFTISGGNANVKESRTINRSVSSRNSGGGMHNYSSSLMLTNVTLSGNTATSGGGMYNSWFSPMLTNVTLSENTAREYGGGMLNFQSSPTLTDVTLSGNTANMDGGGMYNLSSSPMLTNVTVSGNTVTENGGGIHNRNSSPTLTNVTISGNIARRYGGGMYNIDPYSKPKIYNSIILGNNTGIYNQNATNVPEIKTSLVQGLTATNNGNLDATNVNATDVFVDYQTATTGNSTTAGDFRLKDGAIVINKGNNCLYKGTDKDLAGNSRFRDNTIDLGAYEFQSGNTLAAVCLSPTNNILYVTQNGAGTKDGSSWNNAYGEVADALKYAKETETRWTATNTLQIWVAQGTYKPLYDPADNNFGYTPTNPRDASFLLVNNVQLYGGFAGNETDRNARNWETNKTILSGDLNGDDGANFTNNTDNAYNVVLSIAKSRTEPITSNTILDGFTISGGNANVNGWRTINRSVSSRNSGGGMYNYLSSPMLTNVTLSGNTAGSGGGMSNSGSSSPTLTNVALSGNTASSGGGISNYESSPTLTNVIISGNKANNGGGGMFNNSSSPTLTNVIISRNTTSYGGGGMYSGGSSNPILTNVTISGNTAGTDGGGMNNSGASPTLTNVIISGNIGSNAGGGMYNSGASPTLTNVTISGNTATDGGVMFNISSSTPKIYNSIILGNNTGIVNWITRLDVPDIKNSLVQGLENTDNGNISAKDVKATDIFASTTSTDANYLHLKNGVIVINKGDNSLYDATKYGDKDLAGNPRMYNGGVIDLGAYEYQGTLSVSDLNSNKEVKTMVYPNPTTGVFFVKTDKESKAVLYALSGKLLKTISLKKGKNQIDISHLTKGMYLLKTENGTFKVIKR